MLLLKLGQNLINLLCCVCLAEQAATSASVRTALVTASPTGIFHEVQPALEERGLFDHLSSFKSALKSKVESKYEPAVSEAKTSFHHDLDSVVSEVTSKAASKIRPSLPTGDVGELFQNLPLGSQVLSLLDIDSTELQSKPVQVMNMPSYGNWTGSEWCLRVRGNVYRQPDVSERIVDSAVNKVLIGVDVDELSKDEASQAREVMRRVLVYQQAHVNVSVDIRSNSSDGHSAISSTNESLHTPRAEQWTTQLPSRTTLFGDYDEFVALPGRKLKLIPGNGVPSPQILHVQGTGNVAGVTLSFLIPDRGLTIVSDIDDILRVTEVWTPRQAIFNTLIRPLRPWMNMADVYHEWSMTMPTTHFHYLTGTPEQLSPIMLDFLRDTYPPGSYDGQSLMSGSIAKTLKVREYYLTKILQTFPNRKFILVGDTSNPDMVRTYPQIAQEYEDQVQCILMRNTTATNPDLWIPYNTKHFKNLDQKRYMFFVTPDDLGGLDIENGDCYNHSIPQNLTFGWQNLPLGLSPRDVLDGSIDDGQTRKKNLDQGRGSHGHRPAK